MSFRHTFPRLAKFCDTYIPRFVTEDVALTERADGFWPVCSMSDIRPGERFDAVATFRVFNFCGHGLFPKMIGDRKPWTENQTSSVTVTP